MYSIRKYYFHWNILCEYVYVNEYVCMWIYVRMCDCVFVNVCACVCICVNVCGYVWMCVDMCTRNVIVHACVHARRRVCIWINHFDTVQRVQCCHYFSIPQHIPVTQDRLKKRTFHAEKLIFVTVNPVFFGKLTLRATKWYMELKDHIKTQPSNQWQNLDPNNVKK